MFGMPSGTVVLSALLLAFGLVGVAAFALATTSRTPGSSPLAQLFALAWSATYVAAGILTLRRSHLAAPAYLAAMALLTIFLSFIFPGGQSLLPVSATTFLAAALGYRYLRSVS
jgi:hypothetical protein